MCVPFQSHSAPLGPSQLSRPLHGTGPGHRLLPGTPAAQTGEGRFTPGTLPGPDRRSGGAAPSETTARGGRGRRVGHVGEIGAADSGAGGGEQD